MLTSGGERQVSAGCRVRCIHLVLLLECILFSIGTASDSKQEIGDSVVNVESSWTAADNLRNSLNCHLASQESEAHLTGKDSFRSELSLESDSPGLLSFLRRFVAEFSSSAVVCSGPAEKLKVIHFRWKNDFKFARSTVGSSNRRLGPGYSEIRSPARRSLWALNLQQHNGRRRVMGETVSSPEVPQTQVAHLGPPAPADLLNNEKQDWNQDYAEPDVHPPSSN